MISVIIPTRNRADLLADVLESLCQQELADTGYEVLIIDNGSSDHTAEVSERYLSEFSNIRYFHEAEVGLLAGRHRGLREAKGDILSFIDDDIKAPPIWLLSVREAFGDSNVAMVGGNNQPLFIEPPPQWLQRLWQRTYRGGTQLISALSIIQFRGGPRPINPFYVWGCNFSIRKDVLLAAGGFHPDGMPADLIRFRGDGESHISRHVAASTMECRFHPGASIFHKVTPGRMTFDYFYQRGYNQGISDSYCALREPETTTRSGLSRLRTALQKGYAAITSRDAEVRHALSEHKRGHRAGYDFHQQAYREDAELREWVHKPGYYE